MSVVFGNGALLLAISLLNTLGSLIPFEDLQLQLSSTHFHTKHFKGLPAKSDACVLRLRLTVLLVSFLVLRLTVLLESFPGPFVY